MLRLDFGMSWRLFSFETGPHHTAAVLASEKLDLVREFDGQRMVKLFTKITVFCQILREFRGGNLDQSTRTKREDSIES